MTEKQLVDFGESYLEDSINGLGEEEDINIISGELEEAGIDAEASEQKALELIKSAKIEVKKEIGRKFKEEFYRILDEIKSDLPKLEKEEPGLAIAFRKLKDADNINGLSDDKEKMKLIEYLKKKYYNR